MLVTRDFLSRPPLPLYLMVDLAITGGLAHSLVQQSIIR